MGSKRFTNDDLTNLTSKKDLLKIVNKKGFNLEKVNHRIKYEEDIKLLQIELLKLQNWIKKEEKRVVIIFEGRDAAGKGGAIRRFKKYLNPRSARTVALGKPSDLEKGEWYFRRHVKELPHPGEIVFFDRSWYNRAVVEPIMGFCSEEDYKQFIRQVPAFEHMLFEDGVQIIKFWFSITKEEQAKRFEGRKINPLKKWKISPVDLASHDKWDDYSYYAREMFVKSHTDYCPWIIIRTDDKMTARMESIRYVLTLFDYEGKDKGNTFFYPDLNIVHKYHRDLFK